ncbi:agmatine deiminase family protein [Viridibacillus sp. FSL R5-0477]|uniref:Agmatine deiminase n=1 Tax=Viridibacillus arenosi FSL R5-213 TaxID=1227360 RepID=W4F3H8_9BACL|nr:MULTISPECIES: agmatine deiminase family protein [Viridibacillus]ETT86591.1 agmatine deiminase [Viridibacillus arenosi FSL R5-213]OMC83587.1 agmatine deiminase [Viridibacillus sp. FSL H8-0123]OMC88068.1 agmatine deiminase [Viridibacillus arenosi]
MKKIIVLCVGALLTAGIIMGGCNPGKGEGRQFVEKQQVGKYTMPDESSKHEGTWLQWPHSFTYGKGYEEKIEPIWIEMTAALSEGENVHIIAYDEYEKNYINDLLYDEGINMDKIDFYIVPTDDVWARDTAPIFVYDKENNLKLMDWGFNGWGKKTRYKKDALIPSVLSKQLGMERINLNSVVLEGGAFELDGNGTFLSTRSAVTNKNRNPKLSELEIEEYMKENLGANNFIWLDGVPNLDITDFHIDGFAKFHDKSSIITMKKDDLEEWGLSNKDIKKLMNAKNAFDKPYQYVYLPISKNNVILDNGTNLEYKGSYVNFYIGNTVVLVPNYNDPNDKIANDTIQKLYPNRKVVGIDVRELYKDGGMIHCVTQQQPVNLK